jgi:hypothetical protein
MIDWLIANDKEALRPLGHFLRSLFGLGNVSKA